MVDFSMFTITSGYIQLNSTRSEFQYLQNPIEIILNQIKSLFVEAKSIVTCTFQEDQLDDVQQICPSFGAFAAVTGDGRVITWGDDDFGADAWEKNAWSIVIIVVNSGE